MSSSMVKFSSSPSSSSSSSSSAAAADKNNNNTHEGGNDQELDLVDVLEDTFRKAAAISLKDQVLQSTWNGGIGCGEIVDATVYSGLLGTALACLRSYQVTGSQQDLEVCSDIIEACSSVTRDSMRDLTFLCGRGGIYAMGAVVANYRGDPEKRRYYLNLFKELAQERALPVGPEEGGLGMSYDLLYGRAGFLWAALFINKHIGQDTVPDFLLFPIVEAVLAGGRVGAIHNTACPLMYRWHGTRYWGAAHGLAGILHVLLHFPLSEEDAEDIKKTLRYMMSKRFPHSGNYPSSEGNSRGNLVQWSHGAAGIAITLCKASQVFTDDREFRDAAIEAGEVVWKSGLVEKAGLADGASGNAYCFLSLYRLTGESIYVERAKAFGSYLYRNLRKLSSSGNSREHDYIYSLFHGLAGTACLWFDLLTPENSSFPGYEI